MAVPEPPPAPPPATVAPPAPEAARPEKRDSDSKEAVHRGAVQILALLQREGRLLDFLMEEIDSYKDAQIGAVFRSVRMRRGLRQIDVAQRARVSRSRISALEHGELGGMTVDAIRRAASVLQISLDLSNFVQEELNKPQAQLKLEYRRELESSDTNLGGRFAREGDQALLLTFSTPLN